MIILSLIGYLLIFTVIILLAVLIVPLNYRASGYKNDSINVEAEIKWFFGAAAFFLKYSTDNGMEKYFKLFGKQMQEKENLNKDEKSEVKEKKKKNKGNLSPRDFMDKALLESATRLLKDFFKHLKPQVFRVNGKIGFDDPYNTGMASTIIYSLNIPNINIEPVFDDEVLEGSFLIQGRLILGAVVLIFIRFLLTKPVRNIVKKMILKKKGEKIYAN